MRCPSCDATIDDGVAESDENAFAVEKIPVVEREFNQQIGLTAITWNGANLVGYTAGSWFGGRPGNVFTIHEPKAYRILDVRPAPPDLGCLAWDGTGYWAATRKNTRDTSEEPFLYRLDRHLQVTARYPPPGVGCQGMAWDGEHLWIADVFDDEIVILDVAGGSPTVRRQSAGRRPVDSRHAGLPTLHDQHRGRHASRQGREGV